MINTQYIRINAAYLQMSLQPFVAFTGSPSTLRIADVPRKLGTWQIQDVYVVVNYPGNETQTVHATRAGGIWQATIPASSLAGQVDDGYGIYANGIDENDMPVDGYCLGRGYVKILGDFEYVDGTSYRLTLREQLPEQPLEGDVVWFEDDGQYKLYNGDEWKQLGGEVKVPIAKEDVAGVIKATPGFLKVSYNGDIVGLSANEAQHAISADTSIESNHALTADTSLTSNYALTADVANNSLSANYAESANESEHANTAERSTEASHAATADDAAFAADVDADAPGLSSYAKKTDLKKPAFSCTFVNNQTNDINQKVTLYKFMRVGEMTIQQQIKYISVSVKAKSQQKFYTEMTDDTEGVSLALGDVYMTYTDTTGKQKSVYKVRAVDSNTYADVDWTKDIVAVSINGAIDIGVTKIKAGNNITISPIAGTGEVTVNATVPSLSAYAEKTYVDNALSAKADKSELSAKADKPIIAIDEEEFFNGAMPVITQSGEIKYHPEIKFNVLNEIYDELDSKADKASISEDQDKIKKGGIAIIDENEQIKYNPEITLESLVGGDTVVAGNNVSISTDAQGNKVINADGDETGSFTLRDKNVFIGPAEGQAGGQLTISPSNKSMQLGLSAYVGDFNNVIATYDNKDVGLVDYINGKLPSDSVPMVFVHFLNDSDTPRNTILWMYGSAGVISSFTITTHEYGSALAAFPITSNCNYMTCGDGNTTMWHYTKPAGSYTSASGSRLNSARIGTSTDADFTKNVYCGVEYHQDSGGGGGDIQRHFTIYQDYSVNSENFQIEVLTKSGISYYIETNKAYQSSGQFIYTINISDVTYIQSQGNGLVGRLWFVADWGFDYDSFDYNSLYIDHNDQKYYGKGDATFIVKEWN